MRKNYKYYVPNAPGLVLGLRQVLKMMQNREEKQKDLEEISRIVKTKWNTYAGTTLEIETGRSERNCQLASLGAVNSKVHNLDLAGVAQLVKLAINTIGSKIDRKMA